MEKLVCSLYSLKEIINSARISIKNRSLEEKEKADLLLRIDTYEDSVNKQLKLVGDLEESFLDGDMDKVSKIAKRINGFSAFITEDANAIMAKNKGEKFNTNKH